MDFQTRDAKIPKIIGYILMYLIFTTILYYILTLTEKLPSTWNYLHVMMIALLIILLGRLIKLLLK